MEENKQENKELQDAELSNVAGGLQPPVDDNPIKCSCGQSYTWGMASNRRQITDGCSRYTEYQCPSCGRWNRD